MKTKTKMEEKMKEQNILQALEERFSSIERVRTLAIDSKSEILEFLLSRKDCERFFTRIGGAMIFKKEEFLAFLKVGILGESFTSFSNKIHLNFEANEKVVLEFPYKDCILKGGQTKDKEKNKEIFFHSVLAKSEIDVLFSKKVLDKFELVSGTKEQESNKSKNAESKTADSKDSINVEKLESIKVDSTILPPPL
ncbi:site-specific DNA-methyltransferase [Helicobacter himalayensis]|uniref:site-specific DNA-methyltransferase n=1 Tax=Helicobacter himalayensis TaxID=1591088 RepID=UPI003D6EA3AB